MCPFTLTCHLTCRLDYSFDFMSFFLHKQSKSAKILVQWNESISLSLFGFLASSEMENYQKDFIREIDVFDFTSFWPRISLILWPAMIIGRFHEFFCRPKYLNQRHLEQGKLLLPPILQKPHWPLTILFMWLIQDLENKIHIMLGM